MTTEKIARRCGVKRIFNSKGTKNTSVEPLLEVWMRKMARPCGAKHICKSKGKNADGLRPLFEVRMWKNGTPLSREAHVQVKLHKTPRL